MTLLALLTDLIINRFGDHIIDEAREGKGSLKVRNEIFD